MRLILMIIVSLMAFGSAVDTCQDQKQKIGDCDIKYHICNHFQGSSLEYQADAKDEKSGQNEKGDWHSSPDHAAQDATQLLFEKDMKCHGYNKYDCNCQIQEVDSSTCHLQVGVCFYFKNQDDVKNGKVTYRGYAFDKEATDHEGKSDGYSNADDCGHAAANDLFAKYPDTAAKCGYGSTSGPIVNATSPLAFKAIF